MVSTSEYSYFGKIILLIILSIGALLGFKALLPERLFPDQVTTGNANIIMDSLMLAAVADTMHIAVQEVNDTLNVGATDGSAGVGGTNTADVKGVEEVDAAFDPTLSTNGYVNLKRFYSKLYALENEGNAKVRIAYFGDSMNDGDYIVQDVRSEFQENFGGQGVGFVAISSLSANARGSISHYYSKNWESQSFVKVKKPSRPFGIDGQVFFAKDRGQTYWVNYKAQSQRHSTALNKPTLFYGSSRNKNAYLTVQAGKDSVQRVDMNPSTLLNTLQVSETTQSLKVNFHKADSIPIYGFNFDDGKGVHVDNFSTRGNSGLPLSVLNASLMNAFDKELNYDLIILQYGANVLGYGTLNYGWYEKNMTTVVANLRACFPNADILIISTADKSSKIEGVMKTDPAVVPLANSQRNYARNTQSGYINLYRLMGGEGSMVKWVDDKLAGKDYTHFNGSGSKKVARLIYGEINRGYNKHKLNR